MPAPPLAAQERLLATFCKLFALFYGVGAALFAGFPGLTFRLAALGEPSSFGAEAAFWNTLAVAMMVAVALACAVVAQRPRELRQALLPVLGAQLATSLMAALHLPGRALVGILLIDLPLFFLTLLIYRAAAPGIRGDPSRPADPPALPIQIGLPK
ncbi:MAG: hypothetical protein E6J78_02560 [Deltaproteobacteria bacterium]|nr:MAG: hypothetical protein E6J78_02560 [Deltaproteobacteria bacterium]